ncbi:hypothetical protein F2Q68_00030720 [Brassica cretica]|uniref:Uncharacterized protein n=1 Tax=Brassica cretica TaxID=69181 RepID=A0A8S9GCL7_BRACR|nr:hypothetical protein F2Q68_00030720 [Brassica cretica]
MKSSEYPEEFPRKFRGNTKFGFLGIYRGTVPSEYSEEYVRRYIPIDRCIYVQNASIDERPRKYPDEVLPRQQSFSAQGWLVALTQLMAGARFHAPSAHASCNVDSHHSHALPFMMKTQ